MYNYYNELTKSECELMSDLASERRRADSSDAGVEIERTASPVGEWLRVRVTSEEGERSIMRPMGTYDTLSTENLAMIDDDAIADITEELARKLCTLLDECGIFPARILIAGLGNENLTADSIGPKSATRVKPTLHISEYEPEYFENLECSEIAVIKPSVAALSGMDSTDTVRAVSEKLMPDVIFAIDSISAKSTERLGRTFQISSTGLFPGGIGNLSSPITKASMGVPVIGIGVPTVMDARCVISGIGKDDHLYVIPREIDEITSVAATIIGGAINQAFGLEM